MSNNELFFKVSSALYNAAQNGYLETVYEWPACDTAADLIAYDHDLEDEKPEDLIPLIERWRQEYPRQK